MTTRVRAFKSQRDNLRLLVEAMGTARAASSMYRSSYRSALSRVLWSIRTGRFEPAEALVNGVLDPDLSEEHARRFVSKRELISVQERANPRHWYYATEDKGLFYRFCEEAKIRVPAVYALIFKGKQGWSVDGSPVHTVDEIGAFLERSVPPQIIIKPSRGAHGRSVWAITRQADGSFAGSAGKSWKKGREVAGAVLADPFFDAFVIQQRVTSHPGLRELTGSEALQSSRLVTYVNSAGEVKFIAASIRLISGEAIIDNIDWGKTGNFALQLYPDTGKPMDAMTFVHEGRVMHWIKPEAHPKLGEKIRNFQVPEWDKVLELVARAARTFLPLRTLGWDVAITPDGPMIVEANYRWDPMMHPCMRSAVDAIKQDFDPA